MTKDKVLATGARSKLIQPAPEKSPAELPASTSVEGIREQNATLEAERSHSQDKGRLSEGSYTFSLAVENVRIEIHVKAPSLPQIAGYPDQKITLHIMDPNALVEVLHDKQAEPKPRHVYTPQDLIRLARNIPSPGPELRFSKEAPLEDVLRVRVARRRVHEILNPQTCGESISNSVPLSDDEDAASSGGVALPPINQILEPSRQPNFPPPSCLAQEHQGFARFLREHASPPHTRVTAGGRIVQAGPEQQLPPTFHLGFLDHVIREAEGANGLSVQTEKYLKAWSQQVTQAAQSLSVGYLNNGKDGDDTDQAIFTNTETEGQLSGLEAEDISGNPDLTIEATAAEVSADDQPVDNDLPVNDDLTVNNDRPVNNDHPVNNDVPNSNDLLHAAESAQSHQIVGNNIPADPQSANNSSLQVPDPANSHELVGNDTSIITIAGFQFRPVSQDGRIMLDPLQNVPQPAMFAQLANQTMLPMTQVAPAMQFYQMPLQHVQPIYQTAPGPQNVQLQNVVTAPSMKAFSTVGGPYLSNMQGQLTTPLLPQIPVQPSLEPVSTMNVRSLTSRSHNSEEIQGQIRSLSSQHQTLQTELTAIDRQCALHEQNMTPFQLSTLHSRRRVLVETLDSLRKRKKELEELNANVSASQRKLETVASVVPGQAQSATPYEITPGAGNLLGVPLLDTSAFGAGKATGRDRSSGKVRKSAEEFNKKSSSSKINNSTTHLSPRAPAFVPGEHNLLGGQGVAVASTSRNDKQTARSVNQNEQAEAVYATQSDPRSDWDRMYYTPQHQPSEAADAAESAEPPNWDIPGWDRAEKSPEYQPSEAARAAQSAAPPNWDIPGWDRASNSPEYQQSEAARAAQSEGPPDWGPVRYYHRGPVTQAQMDYCQRAGYNNPRLPKQYCTTVMEFEEVIRQVREHVRQHGSVLGKDDGAQLTAESDIREVICQGLPIPLAPVENVYDTNSQPYVWETSVFNVRRGKSSAWLVPTYQLVSGEEQKEADNAHWSENRLLWKRGFEEEVARSKVEPFAATAAKTAKSGSKWTGPVSVLAEPKTPTRTKTNSNSYSTPRSERRRKVGGLHATVRNESQESSVLMGDGGRGKWSGGSGRKKSSNASDANFDAAKAWGYLTPVRKEASAPHVNSVQARSPQILSPTRPNDPREMLRLTLEQERNLATWKQLPNESDADFRTRHEEQQNMIEKLKGEAAFQRTFTQLSRKQHENMPIAGEPTQFVSKAMSSAAQSTYHFNGTAPHFSHPAAPIQSLSERANGLQYNQNVSRPTDFNPGYARNAFAQSTAYNGPNAGPRGWNPPVRSQPPIPMHNGQQYSVPYQPQFQPQYQAWNAHRQNGR